MINNNGHVSLQLSFIVRIVPSPDWFIGVDSLNLCDGDHWKESIHLDLYPYDAGTDSGFTFSSPNFETLPQEKVSPVWNMCIYPVVLKLGVGTPSGVAKCFLGVAK